MTGAPDPLEVAESVPQAAPLQPAPESDQTTPLFWPSLVTVAVNVCVRPTSREEAVGETVTEMVDVTVIVAAADLVLSVTEVAVSVTMVGEGRAAGAV